MRSTLNILEKKFGVSPQDLLIAIGPAIASCCYEVGEDVHSAFRNSFPWWRKAFTSLPRSGKFKLDLPLFVELELQALGARQGNIERISRCTSCSRKFHSYRRDGKGCGRQISYICIDKGDASSIIKI
jgi:copper oxidase (laccase) domain-containing protein